MPQLVSIYQSSWNNIIGRDDINQLLYFSGTSKWYRGSNYPLIIEMNVIGNAFNWYISNNSWEGYRQNAMYQFNFDYVQYKKPLYILYKSNI